MTKIALAVIAGALAILATPASAQNYGHGRGYGHSHAQHHGSYHRPAHYAYRQPSHYGHYGYAPRYHAPHYAPVKTYEQPSHCYYVLQQYGYAYQKVLVCKAPQHQAKVVEAPAPAIEAVPTEPAPAPVEEAPPK